jgi:hypothetical protein
MDEGIKRKRIVLKIKKVKKVPNDSEENKE